ncbi:transporter [Wenyingzhuangia sp. 2_MG-2023]|uniref:transporter n=1 Tax=Wenyingzhuangia sp. 2_MG-2023 TaxID=3062639 RepID=UPI0026E1D317|nr:transporter [Wenyingzhuangia sp. 2_MG-2023]MDO6737804.1 transporter [Wenyingzhuangia sp. 2_MG-2023]MDO6802087.1 transporter [Wenyingzhuangia sp. 1_MG-2023]
MNRILLSIFCYLFFTTTNYAQYTSIINSNRPGHTETPYALGTDVLQFENTSFVKSFKNPSIKSTAISNLLNVRYGFATERLEASFDVLYTHQSFSTENLPSITGAENLAIGLKYLIYQHTNKESTELKKSWNRRYGFKYNGLIPSIALAVHLNTPLTSSNFVNGGAGSFSFSLITQNNISRKLRINNQFDYNYFGGDLPEFIYTISSAYLMFDRFNPFVQLGYHNNDLYSYLNLGIGTPYLIQKNLSVSAYLDASFGNDVSGLEFGINASYRIDKHEDKWVYKKSKLLEDEYWEDEANIDQELLEQELEMGTIEEEPKKDNFFTRFFSKFKSKKKDLKPKKKKKRKKKSKEEDSEEDIKAEKKGFFSRFFKKKEKKEDPEEEIEDVISDY